MLFFKSTLNAVSILILMTVFVFISCTDKEEEPKKTTRFEIKPDRDAYFLDPLVINKFFGRYPAIEKYREPLRNFYEKRRFSSAWINRAGANEYAGNFINLLDREKTTSPSGSILYGLRLHELYEGIIGKKLLPHDSIVHELELLLTVNFFSYAQRNWGGLEDSALKKVNWFIERKQLAYDELLDRYISNPQMELLKEPVYRQYGLLKKYLQIYDSMDKAGGWAPLPIKYRILKSGESDSIVPYIKNQLFILRDLQANSGDKVFDSSLVMAVKKFQTRHGLEQDGNIGKKTWAALQVPLKERIRQILINMERTRWVPAQVKGEYLGVNIPEFKLHVYNEDSLLWSCNVIVGKSDPVFNSVIFSDEMESIVLSPYWNITKNILRLEILPEIKKDPGYLASHNLEVVDHSGKNVEPSSISWHNYTDNFPYSIRERPGVNNSLGLVKFLFPNRYDIYLHDTPAKSLFKEPRRAFSHGCIRVEEPFRLARFLLKDDTSWTDEKIMEQMVGGKEVHVRLKKKIPVFLVYFTSFVDRAGRLNFREDVYSHDQKMKNLLFVN